MKYLVWKYKNNKNRAELRIISIEKPTEDAVTCRKNLEDAYSILLLEKNRRKNKMLKLEL